MLENRLQLLLEETIQNRTLILCVISAPFDKARAQKISIRPLIVKDEIVYQLSEQVSIQIKHYNMSAAKCLQWLQNNLYFYKQTFCYTKTADYQILINKKQVMTILKKAPTKASLPLTHNRQKNYVLQEGTIIPFMIELGLITSEGKLIAKKSDKFRQINRFLEMIDDILPYFDHGQPIHITDFGCGKAYLTFALHYYLRIIKKLNVKIVGFDLKKETIAYCQNLSEQLGYAHELNFQVGDIHTYQNQQKMDMMIALHACDTATDAALEKAIRWQTKVILCAPCCQHELYSQIKNSMLTPLLQHGILKERFAALATDALRAQLLEVMGYHTQVLEFVEIENTPKNLLIRAVRNKKTDEKFKKWQEYLEMKKSIEVEPSLEKFLKSELQPFYDS